MRDRGIRVSAFKYLGSGLQVSGIRFWDQVSGIKYLGSGMEIKVTGFGFWDQVSWIRDYGAKGQGSEIRDQEWIWDLLDHLFGGISGWHRSRGHTLWI